MQERAEEPRVEVRSGGRSKEGKESKQNRQKERTRSFLRGMSRSSSKGEMGRRQEVVQMISRGNLPVLERVDASTRGGRREIIGESEGKGGVGEPVSRATGFNGFQLKKRGNLAGLQKK